MPVFLGGRKAKELYFGGRKIKEAWINGNKVYSSEPPRWAEGTHYSVGDVVSHRYWGETHYYRCLYGHTASKENDEPGWGSFWGVYWEEIT